MLYAPAQQIIEKFRAKAAADLNELFVLLNKDLHKVFKAAISDENIDEQTFVSLLSSLVTYSGKTAIDFGTLTHFSSDSVQHWLAGEQLPAQELRRKYLELCFSATFALMPHFSSQLALILPEYFSAKEVGANVVSRARKSFTWLTPLHEVEGYKLLSVRIATALYNGGSYELLGDLLILKEAELLRTPNLGRKSLKEIQEWLAFLGLRLNAGVTSVPEPDELKVQAFLDLKPLRDAFGRRVFFESKIFLKYPDLVQKIKAMSSQEPGPDLSIGKLATIPRPQLEEYFDHNHESIRVIEEYLKSEGLHIGMDIPPGVEYR